MSVRTRVTAIAGMLLLATVSAAPAVAVPEFHPSRLSSIGDARQVVTVTAPSWNSTTATLRTYEKSKDGTWRIVHGPVSSFLGYGGLAAAQERRQGTGDTPAGTFAIVNAFGRSANPGTDLPYRRVDRDDAWTYNPKVPSTYNLLQTAPVSWRGYGSYVEMLWSYGRQYDYVAVLDYNLPEGDVTRDKRGIRRTEEPANTAAGGGIFLHVSKGKPTAGCISVARPTMKSIMQWLDPAKDPVLVVGPVGSLR